MIESEIQPKRVLPLRLPKKRLELLRVMADEWEYEALRAPDISRCAPITVTSGFTG